jgi:signal transduction histidine kinase
MRLAAFYTVLLGVILAFFGTLVYARSVTILVRQVDIKLESAAHDAGSVLFAMGGEDTLITYDSSILLHLYNLDGMLINLSDESDFEPPGRVMDSDGLAYCLENLERNLAELTRGGVHYKVLTVPVMIGEKPVGVLQAGTSLEEVDRLRTDLLRSLVLIGTLVVSLAGPVGYYTVRQALQPLVAVTNIASEITKAEDLSRRIPEEDLPPDEIGAMVVAFNETLGRLEHLFNSQRRFLADVSHELRTPLTVIRGNAELMRRMEKPDKLALDSMELEISRLTRMVEDLLLMVQAESGRLELDFSPVELDTILLEVYQQSLILAGKRKQINLIEIDQVQVCGDRDRLKQVILNLVGNAIKYTGEDGDIRLRLGKENGMAYLAVTDNGSGIHPDDLEKIFERFFRAEKSRKKFVDFDNRGYGLGLSIAYWIVLRHDGRLEVETEFGSGSTFTVWLPLLDEDGECEAAARGLGRGAGEPESTGLRPLSSTTPPK